MGLRSAILFWLVFLMDRNRQKHTAKIGRRRITAAAKELGAVVVDINLQAFKSLAEEADFDVVLQMENGHKIRVTGRAQQNKHQVFWSDLPQNFFVAGEIPAEASIDELKAEESRATIKELESEIERLQNKLGK